MSTEIKIATFNCRGINDKSKIYKIVDLLEKFNVEICFLQETHLDSSKTIEDYKSIFLDRNMESVWTINDNKSKGVAIIFSILRIQLSTSKFNKGLENI